MSTSKKSGSSNKCCTPCGCYKTNSSGTKKLANKNGAPTAPSASSCSGNICGEYAIDSLSNDRNSFTIREVSKPVVNKNCTPPISSDKTKDLNTQLADKLKNAVYNKINSFVTSPSGFWLEKGMIFKGCFDFEAIICKDDMNITETPLNTFTRG